MFERICLVHYHEIGLKGRNRFHFEKRLQENIKASVKDLPCSAPQRMSGHLVCVANEDSVEEVSTALAAIPGVVRVSIGWRCDRQLHEIYAAARQALLDCGEFETFKVKAKRSNTDFELHTMEINRLVGADLCAFAPDKKVQMKDPDVTVHVQVIQGHTYVYSRAIKGVGGLPVGSAGRVVSLLSAGIDSPVASWMMARRGAQVIGVHFSGRPQTSDSSEQLVDEIVEQLRPCAGIARVYMIPIGDYQRQISLLCPPKLRVIMYRRLMFAVASRIADLEHAGALVTGESLGQVASQTLSNIRATNEMATLPVFRPLIGSDKSEIIAMARKLGTFDLSIQNTDDCCTLFMPRNPETHADLDEVHAAWYTMPTAEWIEQIISNLEYRDYYCPSYHPGKDRPRLS